MADRLREQGLEPAMVALVEVPAPRPRLTYVPYYLDLLPHLCTLGPAKIAKRVAAVLKANRSARCAKTTIGKDRATTNSFEEQHISAYIRNRAPVYDANRQSTDKHRSRHYPGPVTLYCGKERESWMALGDTLDWKTLALRVDLQLVSGDHRSVLYRPAIDAIAKGVEQQLSPFRGKGA